MKPQAFIRNATVIVLVISLFVTETQSISCYVCNSEYDPSCGDPFNPYTIGILNCSLAVLPDHLVNRTAKLCRKIVQKIEGKERIVRSCGYIEELERDDKECIKRGGTHDIAVEYCSCSRDLCNKSIRLKNKFYILVISVLIIISINEWMNI